MSRDSMNARSLGSNRSCSSTSSMRSARRRVSNRSCSSRLRSWKIPSVDTVTPSVIKDSSNAEPGGCEVHASASSTCTPPTPWTAHDRPSPAIAVFSSIPTSRLPVRHGGLDEVREPRANPSSASQCGTEPRPGEDPQPGLPQSASNSSRGCRAPCHRGMPRRRCIPRTRARIHRRATAPSRTRYRAARRPGTPGCHPRRRPRRRRRASRQVASARRPPWSSAARPRLDAEPLVMVEARPPQSKTSSPSAAAASAGSAPAVPAPADPGSAAIDRLGPGIELPGPSRRRTGLMPHASPTRSHLDDRARVAELGRDVEYARPSRRPRCGSSRCRPAA